MESIQLNHKIFKTAASDAVNLAAINQTDSSTNAPYTIPYTEIMLCEYCHLVNSLAKLDNAQLQGIQGEVDKVLSKLNEWLDKTGSTNAVELFSALRHLKQKANTLTKQISQKSSIIDSKTNRLMLAAGSYSVKTQ
jgi:ElaB/YqjD/DUF883 family membrane-anchored ribosome-binding protein